MSDSTDNATDWEGFARDLLDEWPVRDVEGSELFEAALRNGLIAEIPGGYDPEQHIDAEGICPEAGDPWYEYAFHPARADLAPGPLADPRVKALVEALIRIEDLTQHNMGMSAQDERCVNREARAALAAFEGGTS